MPLELMHTDSEGGLPILKRTMYLFALGVLALALFASTASAQQNGGHDMRMQHHGNMMSASASAMMKGEGGNMMSASPSASAMMTASPSASASAMVSASASASPLPQTGGPSLVAALALAAALALVASGTAALALVRRGASS